MQPQSFKQYKNYCLPDYIVKESKNVLSLGVHRDVGWEQSMLEDNPNLNIHLYDLHQIQLKCGKAQILLVKVI